MADIIKVKRDGPRGWHWIARSSFDPAVHQIVQDDPLDHDADGRKGGSMPHDFNVNGSGTVKAAPPAAPKPTRKPAKRRSARK